MKPGWGTVYKITNILNGKVYIGQTKRELKCRWSQHKYKNINSPIHLAIKKYGVDAFRIEALEECPLSKIDDREKFWISHYKSYIKKYGYNIMRGGQTSRIRRFKLSRKQVKELIQLDSEGISHIELGKRFDIDRKTVTIILRRTSNYKDRKSCDPLKREDYKDIVNFILTENPKMNDVAEKFGICRMSVSKIAKSIGYRFLTSNERRELGI